MTAKTAERRYSMVVSVMGNAFFCALSITLIIGQGVLLSWFTKDDFALGAIAGSISTTICGLIGFAASSVFSDWQRPYSPIPKETDK